MNKRIFLILLLGLALRLAGISFGLPHLYHADEPIVVNHALAYGSGDLNPHFFNIPPLTSYLLFVLYGIYFIFGFLTGRFHSTGDFEILFFSDPSSFYLIARVVLGALLGTASVALLYRLIKKHFGVFRAETTAFLFAIYFLHVRDSHYLYADIPLIFSMLVAFALMLKSMDSPSFKNYALTGFSIGTAAAFKYNGIFLWFPFLFIFMTQKPQGCFKKLFIGFGACIFAFILFNPYAVLDLSFFIKELSEQGVSQGGAGWIHHFRYSWMGSAGLPMLAAALSGVVLAVLKKDLKRSVFACFILTYYAVLALKGQHYDRYVLPLIPATAFFAADFLCSACENKKNLRRGVFVLLLLGVSIPSLTRCYLWISLMLQKDVRTVTKEWIESHLPSGSVIAMDWDFYMPRLRMSQKQLEAKKLDALGNPNFSKIQIRRLEQMIERSASGIAQYELYTLADSINSSAEVFLLEKPKRPYDYAQLKSSGVQYAVIGAQTPASLTGENLFYQDLRAKGQLVIEFTPYKNGAFLQSLDQQPLTGGPFLLADLQARKRNGQPLQVYKIQ